MIAIRNKLILLDHLNPIANAHSNKRNSSFLYIIAILIRKSNYSIVLIHYVYHNSSAFLSLIIEYFSHTIMTYDVKSRQNSKTPINIFDSIVPNLSTDIFCLNLISMFEFMTTAHFQSFSKSSKIKWKLCIFCNITKVQMLSIYPHRWHKTPQPNSKRVC